MCVTCVYAKFVVCTSKEGQTEISKAVAVEPYKNQFKKQTSHLRLILDMNLGSLPGILRRNISPRMVCQHVTKKEEAVGHKI